MKTRKSITVRKIDSPELEFDINSSDLVVVKQKRSNNKILGFYEILKFKLQNRFNKTRQFLLLHPLIGYSSKRILYGIITLIVGIALLFLILRSVMHDNNFVPESFYKLHPGIKEDDPIYINYLNNRLKQLGLYGNIFVQMGTYLYNIIPFIPKQVVAFNGADVAQTYTSFFYLGVVSQTSIATPGASV
jgi:oligopeptide transport system permease protein